MDNTLNNPIENKNKKPDWLTALESQSWQAELIASGLAIVGSLSLGPHINNFSDNMLALFDDSVLSILKYAMVYVYMAHTILLVSFVGHLILRIVWAGFLGLSSVYPKGINIEKESIYTKSFLKKLKLEFPDISSYSISLDNSCSIMFSLLCSIVIFLLSITLWIFFYILFYKILNSIFSPEIVKYILIGLGSTLFIFLIILSVITTGPKKNSEFAEKYSYSLNRFFSKSMFFIAYKPMFFMTWTIRTNINTKQFIIGLMLILFPTSFYTSFKMESRLNMFSSESYHELNNQLSDVNSSNYIDEISDTRILRPSIQSREINSNYIKLFIPKLRRDEVIKKETCGSYDANNRKNEISKDSFENECLNKYYQISINDTKYPNLSFQYIKHPHKNEKGYLVYLPIDSIPSGQHILEITTAYKYEENKNSIRLIPFYKN